MYFFIDGHSVFACPPKGVIGSCSSLNYKGAEAEYFEKLEDVRKDLEELEAIPARETKKALRKQGRFLIYIFAAAAFVAALLTALILWQKKDAARYEERKEQRIWRMENLPVLEELYEQGDYEELMKLYAEGVYEVDAYLGEWEHSDFCDIYESILILEAAFAYEKEGGELETADYAGILCEELTIFGIQYGNSYDRQEFAVLSEHGEEILKDFEKRWNWQEHQEDYNSLIGQLEENGGWIAYSSCKEFAEKWVKENQG